MLIDNNIITKPEKYELILCKPNREQIASLGMAYNIVYSPKYNGTSELSFSIPKVVDGIETEYYDKIKGKMLILLPEQGYYEIQNPETVSDGGIEIKSCTCYSQEYELSRKKIMHLDGTYKLWDTIEPENSLLGILINLIPSWQIGSVDLDLMNKSRTFKITEQTLLNFILKDLEQAYECIVEFDTIKKEINFKQLENIGQDSGLYLSKQNLIKEVKLTELADEVVTKLYVYGADDLTIRGVNPSGTNYIQDYLYFKTTEWMSQGLIDGLNSFETAYDNNKTTYEDYLVDLKTHNSTKLTYENNLAELNGELYSLEDQKSAKIQANLSLTEINSQITAKKAEITTKNNEITDIISTINGINSQLNIIANSLKLESYLTQEQIEELDIFTIEDTYQSNAYIVTDSMSYNEKQDVENELLQEGIKILQRVNLPRLQFDIDLVDLLKIVEYSDDWEKLKLADFVDIELRENLIYQVRLVGYEHDWDNNSLKLQFSNKYKMDGQIVQLQELLEQSVISAKTHNFEKYKYGSYIDSGDKSELTQFINSAIDTVKNNVISGENQEIKIDNHGIWLRKYDDQIEDFSDEQMRIINNTIAISDDGFDTARIGIGKIHDYIYGDIYGIAAPLVVGKLLAGNNLRIENSNNKFLLDENGAQLTDATFTMTTSDNKGKIILDPDQGIKIQGNDGNGFTDKFYVDGNGNAVFKGNLEAATGTFSGSLDAANGTFSGSLDAADGTFNGTVNVSNSGVNVSINPVGTDAFKITSGVDTIFRVDSSGNVVLGGNITWNSKPSYNASEVGALSSSYSGRLTEITPEGIYTGTVQADQIEGRIAELSESVTIGEINEYDGELIFYNSINGIAKIYSYSGDAINLYIDSYYIRLKAEYKTTFECQEVDFSYCNNINFGSNKPTAVFA